VAKDEYIKILEQGVSIWNQSRIDSQKLSPDLSDAQLSDAKLISANLINSNLISANLSGADLSRADLTDAKLIGADLSHAKLSRANLNSAKLSDADLTDADLSRAVLSGARLMGADLSNAKLMGADLSNAKLSRAKLISTNISNADLRGMDLSEAKIGSTTFADNDLSTVKGLDSVIHEGPSTIGIDTLYKSAGKIPESFLRGCGVPDEFITMIPSLIGALEPIQFYSCFISYSTKDEEFAKRLFSRMRDDHLRVWFAPEHIKGGQKVHEQIEEAIRYYDKLLVVLSEHSMQSEWVMTELRNARQTEIRNKRRKLFPIRLVDFDTIRQWKCFDADTGKDLAVELREYFIPDFSNWKDHDSFEESFKKLLGDLRAAES
jgi:hypothetical protein